MTGSQRRTYLNSVGLSHLEKLYRVTSYMLDSNTDTENLILESFVRAYQLQQQEKSKSDIQIQLFRIMAGLLSEKHCLSSDSLMSTYGIDEADDDPVHSWWINRWRSRSPDQPPFSAISENDVEEAIRDLPRELRLIVVLSLLAGFSYREIAEIAGVNVKTIKSRLFRGRRLMQKKLFDNIGYGDGLDAAKAGQEQKTN